jgi:hypothetical protein
MTDSQIIKALQEKELYLVNEISKVRAALAVYINDNRNIEKIIFSPQSSSQNIEFDQYMTNDQRVIYALRKIKSGVVDNIVDVLIREGDETSKEKLFKRVTTAASRLYRQNILKADTRGKKYRYAFNESEVAEKQRAEILPLSN